MALQTGPLGGVRVVELAGLGPGPFACMLLADMGAEVIRVDRPGGVIRGADAHGRGRRSIVLNLKEQAAVEVLLALVDTADVLVEGFRPGVAERLGVGPLVCHARNPRLVYGRMTGWGQDGPLAHEVGHDITYLALSGALHAIGPEGGEPAVPLNLVADYGGGGAFLALGVTAALAAVRGGAPGQVVDAAMVDGVAAMMAPFHAMVASGRWSAERGTNLLDSGAPFYRTYRTVDDRWIAVGAIEAPFYRAFVTGLGLDPAELPPQQDPSSWPELRARFARIVASRSRDEWVERFTGTDACVAPVLTPAEAVRHPHAVARGMFHEVDGVVHPAPAPRFGTGPAVATRPTHTNGTDTDALLTELGFDAGAVEKLRAAGAVG
jgi:alpha-methylacyl-CoA racemase